MMDQNITHAQEPKRFSRRHENPFASPWIGGIGPHFIKAANSGGAGADADLVAWLLTHREELLRLAAIGQKREALP